MRRRVVWVRQGAMQAVHARAEEELGRGVEREAVDHVLEMGKHVDMVEG